MLRATQHGPGAAVGGSPPEREDARFPRWDGWWAAVAGAEWGAGGMGVRFRAAAEAPGLRKFAVTAVPEGEPPPP